MIRLVLRSIVLTALLVGACGHSALAQDRATHRATFWDFTLQTRYIGSVEITGDGGASAKLEDDLGWGFGFGYNVNERFNIGFFTSWRYTNYNAKRGVDGIAVDSLKYSGSLETATIGLSGDWNILPRKFTPYVSGSIGYTLVDTNIPTDAYSGCWYDPWYGYVCGTAVDTYTADAASYSLGAGVRLELSKAVFFKVGYEHDWIDFGTAQDADVFRLDGGLMF